MSVEMKLTAQKRTDTGKGASRRLRRAKAVPGIVYGAGKEPEMIELSAFELARLMELEAFYSQIIDLSVGNKKQQTVVKDLQRHPYKDRVLHIDFQRVKAGEKLHVGLPIHFVNEEKCKGVKAGGVVHRDMIEVAIIALPKDLPEYLEVDLADLDVGEAVHLSELNVPEGVELEAFSHGGDVHDHDHPVVSIVMPRIAREEDEDEAEGEAEEPAAEDTKDAGDAEEKGEE
ncbi:50S ribosomal protein L25/general stress protein Ctc [Methylonatrum kenyense]|uniref:50S ribosomal protein L25/general stress protein Ctc n=1 Tax=Methylonatrum kenyense TaxID=455253 RepID=UPI0020BFEF7A|nr:50S ribosomal protein L25/general stress protein Ctc [Methylonatrum kenyense]MCK8516519.1 50S ribosomal protein L25/general stress protein Ctc [Methylonatrum kenyense]